MNQNIYMYKIKGLTTKNSEKNLWRKAQTTKEEGAIITIELISISTTLNIYKIKNTQKTSAITKKRKCKYTGNNQKVLIK